ncbi:MAG: HAMP domain-containing protein [Spirochaetales bacterium]|nr:HAMP domain-containing protein [Spirochaetales bacterium]
MKTTLCIDKKYCFKVSLIYFASVLFANIIASLIPVSMPFPALHTEEMRVWRSIADSCKILNYSVIISTFLIPSVLCLWYCFSILLAKDDETIAKKVVNLPIRFSLWGMLGWILGIIYQFLFYLYTIFFFKIDLFYALLSGTVFFVLEAILSFVVSYFVTETVNRGFVLPRLFPDGHVSKIPGVKKFSLNFLFLFFFITVSLFPIIFILSSFVWIQISNNIPLSWGTIGMAIILFCSSIGLTIVFMRLFTVPLKKLTIGTERIKAGDYYVRVKNISNDEMGILSDTFNEMAESLKEKEFIRDTFGKVVDPNVRDYFLKGNISLGGENRLVTVMFCDIRSFTSMSENMEPAKVVALLNDYFTRLGKCITKNHGVINKYIGDAIMAIFGAPLESANHALDAYNAALEMRKSLVLLNEDFASKGLPTVRFGIGLHSGSVLAGNIGAEDRMEYTVIGDTVNTASRIESLCKNYDTDLLISGSSAELLKDTDIKLQFVDEAAVRGKTEKVKLYTS